MHPESSPSKSTEPARSSRVRAIVGAIPARFGSTRLPGKALLEIDGRPMVEHVYRRAQAVETLHRVVVLTDDERIAEAVDRFGGRWQMTPADCTSGTDRIAHAVAGWQRGGEPIDAVLNIQGDEPLVETAALARLAAHLADAPDDPIATLAAPLEAERLNDPNSVKVVLDARGYALYFSRAGIPYPRDDEACPPLLHVGVYGYQTEALLQLAALPPSRLELAESLEQLRALENGLKIRVLRCARAWPGVDTMDDLERVRRRFAERSEPPIGAVQTAAVKTGGESR